MSSDSDSARISVIIPTLYEEGTIRGAVRGAFAAGADEVIVADGGSPDRTAERARAGGARVVQEQPGRGAQLNAGAAAASGDVLWFLHADTRVAPGSCALVLAALRDPDVVGGHFRVSFGRSTHARLLAAFYHVIQRFGVVYGDSAVFCRRTAYEAAGGFPPHPIMEDLAFVQALRRRGRLAYVAAPIYSSPRRWERGGVAQAWGSWLVIQSLYFLRVPPTILGQLYRQIR